MMGPAEATWPSRVEASLPTIFTTEAPLNREQARPYEEQNHGPILKQARWGE